MTQREAFEAWARVSHVNRNVFTDDQDLTIALPMSWSAWQAAQAQAAEPVGKVLDSASNGNFLVDFSKRLPAGTMLYTAPQQQAVPLCEWEKQQAAMKLALDALQLSRDDVEFCLAENLQLAGYERYDKRIAFYKEQLIKHDAAIAALEKLV